MSVITPQVPPGYRVVCFDDIDSTNAEALRQADANRDEPLWIIAQRQKQGRGRRGRKWITAPGNLFATLLLNWKGPSQVLSELSFVAAVSCADMLEKQMEKTESVSAKQVDITLKWPNDILLNGAKAGGILIETSGVNTTVAPTAVAIGIGLNVAHHPAETLVYPTTDFAEHGLHQDSMQIFEMLAAGFAHYFSIWQNGNGFALIKQRWLEFGPLVGQELKVNTGTDMITGYFNGLEQHGELQLRLRDGSLQTILAGDIIADMRAAHSPQKDRF